MKIVSFAFVILASAGSVSAATAFDQAFCEQRCSPADQTCKDNCAKSCDDGFDIGLCRAPCDQYQHQSGVYNFYVKCLHNCDAKACSASSSSESDANLVDTTKERDDMTSERDAAKSASAGEISFDVKTMSWKSVSAATAFDQAFCEQRCSPADQTCKDNCAKSCDDGFDMGLCRAPCHQYQHQSRVYTFYVQCLHNCDAKACSASSSSKCDANLVDMTKERDDMTSELTTANAQLATKETKLATCTSSLILIQREHRDAHQMRVRMTNERDTARSEAARAKRERDSAKSELVAMTSERDAAKECKAKSPNYKAPVNDECNPKNCDEWDCGQWCVCYNADHDATYEALGCASDDEDMCQCD